MQADAKSRRVNADPAADAPGADAASSQHDHLQVLIISLVPEPPTLAAVQRCFPQAVVHPAVDLRGSSMLALAERGLVSLSALETAMSGRLRQKEFTTPGAVGLQQSTQQALAEALGPLLLLEEDCELQICIPVSLKAIRSQPFDVAVFGAIIHYCGRGAEPRPIDGMPGWLDVSGQHVLFFRTHCVYYSACGREIVTRHMQAPQEVQVDALLGILSMAGRIRLALQIQHPSATQHAHVSTVGHTRSFLVGCVEFTRDVGLSAGRVTEWSLPSIRSLLPL